MIKEGKQITIISFSDLAKLLYLSCGDGVKQTDFILVLIDNFMEEPSNETDKQKSADGEYNPLFAVQPNTLKSYFNGNSKISAQNATIILGRADKARFEDYITKFSSDALDAICIALAKYNVSATSMNVGEICADLMEKALRSTTQRKEKFFGGKEDTEFSDDRTPTLSTVRLPSTPLAQVFIRDGKIHIGKTTINLPEKLKPPAEVLKAEMGYVLKLFEAYSDEAKPIMVTQNNLSNHPKYLYNFNEQREHYFNAVYVMERVRDVFDEKDGNQFDILKKETYDGISEVYYEDYNNGFTRLKEVLKRCGILNPSKSLLCNIPNLVGISEIKGVCHILVSDGTIRSWVVVYG